MVPKPPVPAHASQRSGSDDRDTSETSSIPRLPLTAGKISVHQPGLCEIPQSSVALATDRPSILTGPTIRFDESVQAPATHDCRGSVSRRRQTHPGLADTLRNVQLTPFGNLTLDIHFGERPPLPRSSSLEVHVPSPIPQTEQLESPTAPFDYAFRSSQDLRTPTTSEDEISLTIQHPTRRYSFAGTTTTEPSSFIVLTPQLSGTESISSSIPVPPLSPWQLINNPAGSLSSPHLMTAEEISDGQLYRPCSRLDNDIPEHGGIIRNYGRQSSIASGGHSDERQLPPRIDAPKYPPCWTTDDGLLIVPSVPGDLAKDVPQQVTSGNQELVETSSSNKAKHKITSNNSDPAEALVEFAALSPNVTTYRKGNCPRKKRSPSYYDLDILPRQRMNYVH